MLGGTIDAGGLGRDFGATLSEREVVWLMDKEFAQTAHDIVWRRSKLGLRMSAEDIANLDRWMQQRRSTGTPAAAE